MNFEQFCIIINRKREDAASGVILAETNEETWKISKKVGQKHQIFLAETFRRLNFNFEKLLVETFSGLASKKV